MSDTELDNRNSPSYLSHYGMFRAPFKSTQEDDMYYAEPTRTQRLDILLHLAQYGNELLLVTGPEDSGKTTMLNQFLKRASDDWKVCHLDAQLTSDRTQFLHRLNRCFGFADEKLPIEPALGNLKRRLEAMLATQQTIVIVVDNAHKASTEILDLLLEYSSIRDLGKGVALRILLFSEPQIKIHLASPELQARQSLAIRKIDLPPFNEQQTSRLIRHRVTTAGLVSKNVFNEAIIAKIYKYSDGWPGSIAEIAHQVLFESTPLKQRDNTGNGNHDTTSKSGSVQALTIFSGLIVVGALLGLVVFQDEVNKLFGSTSTSQHADEKEQTRLSLNLPGPSSARDEKEITISDNKDNSDIKGMSDDDDFPDLTDISDNEIDVASITAPLADKKTMAKKPQKPAPVKPAPASGKQPKKSPSATPRPAPVPKVITFPIKNPESGLEKQLKKKDPPLVFTENTDTRHVAASQPAVQTSTQAAAQTQTTKIPTAIPAEKQVEPITLSSKITLERQEDWVLAQSNKHYTLQLVAGYQATTINKFISKKLLPETEFAYYFSLNKGKNWHSLLYGVYDSRSAAGDAASELSKQVSSIRPWIRPLKNIQNDIRYARNRKQDSAVPPAKQPPVDAEDH